MKLLLAATAAAVLLSATCHAQQSTSTPPPVKERKMKTMDQLKRTDAPAVTFHPVPRAAVPAEYEGLSPSYPGGGIRQQSGQ